MISEKREAPPILYHYTTAEGLLGILQSSTIWASQATHLNDPSEVAHGLAVFKEALSLSTTPSARVIRDAAMDLQERQMGPPMLPFAACFSDDEDGLYQWRTYGLGGAGYAIGFDSSRLFTEAKNKTGSFDLVPVEYDRDRQLEKMRSVVETLLPHFEQNRDRASQEGVVGLLTELCGHWLVSVMASSVTRRAHPSSGLFQCEISHQRGTLDPLPRGFIH